MRVNDSIYDVIVFAKTARINGAVHELDIGKEGDEITLDGEKFRLDFLQEGDPSVMIINGMVFQVSKVEQAPEGDPGSRNIKAPMSGQLVDVAVSKGSEVKKGQLLVVLEAMKMENQIKSAFNGRIAQVRVSKGQHVKLGDILVEFE